MFQVQLRPYQENAIHDILRAWDSCQSVLFQMPTGTGKTTLFCEIARQFDTIFYPGQKILIITHRKELVEQAFNRLVNDFRMTAGIIAASYIGNSVSPIQVASIQTLVRRENEQQDVYSLVIIDEAHHALASTYRKLWEFYPSAKFLGVTATPVRTNGEGFNDLFEVLITTPSIKWFVREHYLADTRYYASHVPDFSNIKIRAGDYDETELAEVMQHAAVMADLVQSYLEFAADKKVIVFAVNRMHSAKIVERYNKHGISAKAIDTHTTKDERQQIVADFRQNKFKVLCNVNIFTEGFDCPDVDAVQLARPTKSLTLFLQQMGRCMRPFASKEYGIILDNAGLWKEHGLPKMDRQWSLTGAGVDDIVGKSPIVGIKEVIGRDSHEPMESKSIRLVELDEAKDLDQSQVIDYNEIEKDLTNAKIKTMRERIESLQSKIKRLVQRAEEETDYEIKQLDEENIAKLKTELEGLLEKMQPKRFEQVLDLLVKASYDLIDSNEIFVEGDRETFIARFVEPYLKWDKVIADTYSINAGQRGVSIPATRPILSGEVEIFHTIKKAAKTMKAVFDPSTQKVQYGSNAPMSPSAAAIEANFDATDKRTSINGWTFWKYLDEDGNEQCIKNFMAK